MKVLAIDTASLMASVAIAEARLAAESAAGSAPRIEVLAWRESDVDTHSDKLLPLIDAALCEASLRLVDLDGIAVGAGPGSFTGLRIGMATAKGLAFAADKPMWAISSLAALAMDFACPPPGCDRGGPEPPRDALLIPLLDARRREVFAGFYRMRTTDARGHGMEAVADERVLPPDRLAAIVQDLVAEGLISSANAVLVGDAMEVYRDALTGIGDLRDRARRTPSAVSVARLTLLARELPDVLLSGAPVYIRPSEAEIKFPRGNPGGTFASRK